MGDLRELHERASQQARRVVAELEWLVESPFPGMFRRVEGRPVTMSW